MSEVREVWAPGLEALELTTRLLQRARLADAMAGLWEAADFQWWWRAPRQSDRVEKLFWVDDAGPIAGVQLTNWSGNSWQCDPLLVPGAGSPMPEVVWTRALELAHRHAPDGFTVPVDDADTVFRELALRSGLTPGFSDNTAWLAAGERPEPAELPEGFTLLDRAQRPAQPHPLAGRNGPGVEQRLAQCALYDPQLDLAVLTDGGQVAGYSLYWFDPVTRVGLVEPVRVEDGFQRRGLARAMLSSGIDRLRRLGALRVKVSYESAAAGALYQGVGFRPESSTTWFETPPAR